MTREEQLEQDEAVARAREDKLMAAWRKIDDEFGEPRWFNDLTKATSSSDPFIAIQNARERRAAILEV